MAKKKTPPNSTADSVTSMKSQNLYHLSLVCFSFSLILFVSTYNLIANHGGAAAVLDFDATTAVREPMECFPRGGGPPTSTKTKNDKKHNDFHGELLIGYNILHHTLYKESQLKYLHWLRDATFRGPKGSLKSVLTTIYSTSQARTAELETLMEHHSPAIILTEAPKSAMGDSIQEDVEKSSTQELVPLPFVSSSMGGASSKSNQKHLQWGIRFVFIQAQATRMVVALATSLRKFEENEERKQWLTDIASEYESIRETLVECVLSNLGKESWS